MAVRAAVRPGMPVRFVLIFSACHGVPSGGERIAPPRPQVNPVRRNIREVADEFEVCCSRSAISAEKATRENSFVGFRSIRGECQFGIHLSLLQHVSPEFPLRCDDRFVRPDGRLRALVPGVKHGSPYAFSAANLAGKWDSRCRVEIYRKVEMEKPNRTLRPSGAGPNWMLPAGAFTNSSSTTSAESPVRP